MKLSTRTLLPFILAASAGAAMAQATPTSLIPQMEVESTAYIPTPSNLTRAEVLAQANPSGIPSLEVESTAYIPTPSVLTRAQVRAEAAEANRLGLFQPGELMTTPSTEQLEQVRLAGIRAVQGNPVVKAQNAIGVASN